jgi:hypothetical protein
VNLPFALVPSEDIAALLGSEGTSGLGSTWHSVSSVSPARLSGLLLYLPKRSATPSRACQRRWRTKGIESSHAGACSLPLAPRFARFVFLSAALQQCGLPRAVGWRFPVGKGGDRAAGGGHGRKHLPRYPRCAQTCTAAPHTRRVTPASDTVHLAPLGAHEATRKKANLLAQTSA